MLIAAWWKHSLSLRHGAMRAAVTRWQRLEGKGMEVK